MPTRATKNSLSLLADGVNTLLRIGAPVLDTPMMPLPKPRLLLLLSMLTHSPSRLTVRLLVQAYSTPAPSTHPTSLLLLLRRSAPLPTVDPNTAAAQTNHCH